MQVNLVKKERKIYTGQAARVMKLLGTGCLPVEAARACGCDESYVSQLKSEPDFVEQVGELVAITMAQQSEIDGNYLETEKILSKRMREQANLMFNPDQILRTLKFANEAKRKVPTAFTPQGEGSGTALKPVVLMLPAVLIQKFVVNPNNEIVQVEGQELLTLPSAQIKPLVEKHKRELAAKPAYLEKKSNGSGQVDPYSDL